MVVVVQKARDHSKNPAQNRMMISFSLISIQYIQINFQFFPQNTKLFSSEGLKTELSWRIKNRKVIKKKIVSFFLYICGIKLSELN